MKVELLDYELPRDRIALEPLAERDGSRLLVVPRDGDVEHAHTAELERFLSPGSLLVVNDTRVLPARLAGKKVGSGGRVELLLVQRLDAPGEGPGEAVEERWRALGRASKPLRPGSVVEIDGQRDALRAEVLARGDDATIELRLFSPGGLGISRALDLVGQVPLPPYIRAGRRARPGALTDDDPRDRDRYQTVYARAAGAVAAPTAGLHLTRSQMSRLEARGVEITAVTLHVGLGTFQPVTAADLDQHAMHSEWFVVGPEARAAIDRARERGAQVVAIGTTAVRALESAADPDGHGRVCVREGETRLLIQPGYRFRVVDRLLTNFHLPRSTLLAMVAAFAGLERVLAAYRVAIEAGYRFYSYGDAMLLDRVETPR